MSNDFAARLAALELEIVRLSREIANIPAGERGPVGPRGASGPIDAAVSNAKEALAKELEAVENRFYSLESRVRDFDAKLDQRIRVKVDEAASEVTNFRENTEAIIFRIVLAVLKEHQLLSHENEPMYWQHIDWLKRHEDTKEKV